MARCECCVFVACDFEIKPADSDACTKVSDINSDTYLMPFRSSYTAELIQIIVSEQSVMPVYIKEVNISISNCTEIVQF